MVTAECQVKPYRASIDSVQRSMAQFHYEWILYSSACQGETTVYRYLTPGGHISLSVNKEGEVLTVS